VGDVRAPLLTVTDRDYKDLLLWLEALDLAGPLRPRTTDAEPWVLPSRHATPA
jgi:hypothetical protein